MPTRVGIDVKGKIGKLTFKRGLGNPAGVYTATSSQRTAAARDDLRNAAAARPAIPPPALSGGTIRAKSIGKLTVGPANVLVADAHEPGLRSALAAGISDIRRPAPVTALTNAVITTSGSIGQANIAGHRSSTARSRRASTTRRTWPGSKGRGEPARSRRSGQDGDLINSVASASVRPANNHYSQVDGQSRGQGEITAQVTGSTDTTPAA